MVDFLSLKQEAFGLDISDYSLKAARLKKRGRSLDLASLGNFALKPGVIREGEIQDEKVLTEIVKTAVAKTEGERIKTRAVVASLPEERAFLQVIELPALKEGDIARAVKYEIESYIPLSINDVYWDFQLIDLPNVRSKRINALISAMPKRVVDSYFSVLKKAGLKPLAFEVESTATARALLREAKENEQVLIIDMGATRTGFNIFLGSRLLCVFSIPVCGRIFDRIIAKEFNISLKEAEVFKHKYGLDQRVKIKIENGIKKEIEKGKIFEVLIPSLTDFVEQVKKYINYYYTHVKIGPQKKEVEKIILCGGGAYMEGFKEFLFQEFKIPVEMGRPLKGINLKFDDKSKKRLAKKSLLYSTAIGLALRGTG